MIADRELALAILAVLDAPPADVVEVAAAAGFDAITLRLGGGNRERPDEPEAHPLIGDTPARRATLRRLQETGLGVLDVEVLRLRPDTDVVAVRPMLESAQALGARHLLVVGLDDDHARLAETFGALCSEAEPYRVRPALEFMRMSSVPTVHDADRIVSAAGHPAGAVLVDPLHLARSGGTPADVAPLAAAHPDRYPYVQLCDAPLRAPGYGMTRDLYVEAVQHRLNPGDGELPLRELLDVLPDRIPIGVEAPVAALADRPPAERARASLQATRRLLESVG
ncbi:MAG TPA: TIM barrel protein [Solirubrobacteraceae bacterium]|nr:TIM barrel protein [Solirubrobacteraceae bacterium]